MNYIFSFKISAYCHINPSIFFKIQNKKVFALYVLIRDNNFLKSIYKIYTAK